MAWITPLVIGGSSLLSGALGANASKNAATDEENAAALSSAAQLGMYGQTRTDLLPFMTSGNAALSNLDALMGIKPTAADTPQNTLGPITDAINAKAFGPGPTQRSTTDKLVDPGNLFHGNNTQAIDPLGYAIGGNHDLVGRVLPHLAAGGRAKGAKTYVVGERGPEILHMAPGASGYVEPNSPKANYAAYGTARIPHRLFGGPVGPRTGDPVLGRGGLSPLPYARSPLDYSGPIRRPGMPMMQARAGGGPVEGFNPLGGNNVPLPGSGQTPNQIMAQAPEYQFVEQQGLQGLDQSAAASGNLLSGGHLKDILNYSQGEASQQYQNIFNNLSAVASLGESAGAMVGNSGTYAGMGMGNSIMAGGNAAAAGSVGAANSYNSAFGNLGFLYAMNPGMFGGSSKG